MHSSQLLLDNQLPLASHHAQLTSLSQLISLIYEGATDPSRWELDILPAVAAYMHATKCCVFTTISRQQGGYEFTFGLSQHYIEACEKHALDGLDIWANACFEKHLMIEGNIVLAEELVPRQQLLDSAIYRHCFAPEGIVDTMAGILFGLNSANPITAACSFYRGLHEPTFNAADRAKFALILPHLSRALGVMQLLKTADLAVASSFATLNRLSAGVLLLNGVGAVMFANKQAQRILQAHDGLSLRKPSRTTDAPTPLLYGQLGEFEFEFLQASNNAANLAIHHAIALTLKCSTNLTPQFAQAVKVERPSGLPDYSVQFSALGQHNEFSISGTCAVASIAFISDVAQALQVSHRVLQALYGLTSSEAQVANAVVNLNGIQEVAEALGSSPHTVNTQLKHIYAKLAVDSRTSFVKRMLGLASSLP